MPDHHSFYSPSSSKRWLTCHPSLVLGEQAGIEDNGSEVALEGTMAHSVGENVLRWLQAGGRYEFLDKNDYAGFRDVLLPKSTDSAITLGKALDEIEAVCQEHGFDIHEIWCNVIGTYVSTIWRQYLADKAEDPNALLLIEQELDLGEIVPDCFGTADATIVAGNVLRLYDLKYGRVKVEAFHNTQLMIYGIGDVLRNEEMFDIDVVDMTIIQPRANNIATFTMSRNELMLWASEELRPAAERAARCEGRLVPGEHCRYCRALAKCPSFAALAPAIAVQYAKPELLPDEALAQLLQQLGPIKLWVDAVQAYAVSLAQNGHNIPGWKVVNGRGKSVIKDEAKVIADLRAAGYDDKLILRAPALETITNLKRILRKAKYEEFVAPHVEYREGAKTLVPESDSREALNPSDDFATV